jgi:hypothetical protein
MLQGAGMRRRSRSLLITSVGVIMMLAALVVVGRVSIGRLQLPASSTTATVALPAGVDHPTTTVPSLVMARISFGQPVDGVAVNGQADPRKLR